mgnify:CR=1 FL=1
MLRDKVYSLNLHKPVGIMVDPEEALKFIEFLPDIEWSQAYVVLLLIRSRELKEKYGFKGSDHSLSIHIVPGYYDDPKFKLYLVLRRYAVIAKHSSDYYIYERHTSEGVEYYPVPQPLVGLMVSPNPSDWVRASIDTVNEFIGSLREAMMNPERAGDIVRRIDVRLGANAMRRVKHLYHQIDIDDKSLVPEVEAKVQEILGYMPARIITKRGEHILVKVSDLSKEQAKRWFNEIPKLLIEYKKNFQEPLPGTIYRDCVPRFKPPER